MKTKQIHGNLMVQSPVVDEIKCGKLETDNKILILPGLLPLVFSGLVFFSCVTGKSSESPFERSREKPPHWTRIEAGTLVENSDTMIFVVVRKRLKNLRLGLMQAKEYSLAAGRAALSKHIIASHGSGHGIPMSELHQFNTSILEKVKSRGPNLMRIRDIYYEGIENPPTQGISGTYNIYVMVEIDLAELSEIQGDLSNGRTIWMKK